uniref:Ig-like domain-containing protein n=1 Tax=Paenisporosarcina sp. TG20 TaxID=1211706 RepID=UPI0012F6B853
MKTFLSLMLLLSLLSPLSVKASEENGNNKNVISKDMQKENSLNISLFTEWAMNEEAYIFDYYNSIHTILPKSITSDYISSINLTLEYSPWPWSPRDPIMYWDFYTESQGVLTYDTYTLISYYGTTPYVTEEALSSKYFEQEFIYIRMGTLSDYSDNTLSGVTFKKIRNPYFQGESTPLKTDTVIVSNESTDAMTTQSTGTFSISELNEKITIDNSLPQEAYKVDMLPEFDPAKVNASLFETKSSKNTIQSSTVGAMKNFWVVDAVDNTNYEIAAELKYSGQYGEIWVNNNDISSAQAKEMSDEFDQEIYPLITENFAKESDVDGNQKISILVYDISDGFTGNGGYIGGYFYARDLYQTAYSNMSEIFYIDTYPSMGLTKGSYNVDESFSTIAHEFQHMVNFNQNVLVERGPSMEVWLNEALSMAAEHMYMNGALTNRVQYYELSNSIANGHSLLYWDRAGDVLSNYSLSYLFGQYLRVQAKQGESIYKELLIDLNSDVNALEAIIQKYIGADKTLGEFLTDFRQALYVNEPTGLYGFNGEAVLSEIDSPKYTGSLPKYLRGGGAINVPIEDVNEFSVPTTKGASIEYRLIDATSLDTIPPGIPVVNPVTDRSTVVTGYAEVGSMITVKTGVEVIGEGIVSTDQTFSIAIPKQKANQVLSVTATDAAGNSSEPKEVIVTDATAPLVPTVKEVTDKSTTVSGTAEVGSLIKIKSGTTEIGSGTVDSEGNYTVQISQQKAGTKLVVTATDTVGNTSGIREVTVVDVTAPTMPTVNEVTDQSTSVTGTAEVGSLITIKSGTVEKGSDTVDSTGKYTVLIELQKAGTKLTITATDTAKNNSDPIEVTVTDATAPLVPTVKEVTDKSTTVSGTAEVGSLIIIKSGTTEIGSGTVDSEGNYTVQISQQKAGTKLVVTATDTVGNTSGIREVTVVDVTAPTMPTVNEVTDQSTSVTGTAEVGSLITIKSGTVEKGSDTVDSTGKYTVLIELQKAETKLTITATDTAKNSSDPIEVIVTDATAPLVPTVNEVTDKSTSVSGTAEVGSLIKIKSGTTEIGSGTVDSEGTYTVLITKQKAGTKLSVTATDNARNTSGIREVTVVDVTAPTMPTVNEVTDKSTSVTGSAEVGSTVTIKVGSTIVGTGTTTT